MLTEIFNLKIAVSNLNLEFQDSALESRNARGGGGGGMHGEEEEEEEEECTGQGGWLVTVPTPTPYSLAALALQHTLHPVQEPPAGLSQRNISSPLYPTHPPLHPASLPACLPLPGEVRCDLGEFPPVPWEELRSARTVRVVRLAVLADEEGLLHLDTHTTHTQHTTRTQTHTHTCTYTYTHTRLFVTKAGRMGIAVGGRGGRE